MSKFNKILFIIVIIFVFNISNIFAGVYCTPHLVNDDEWASYIFLTNTGEEDAEVDWYSFGSDGAEKIIGKWVIPAGQRVVVYGDRLPEGEFDFAAIYPDKVSVSTAMASLLNDDFVFINPSDYTTNLIGLHYENSDTMTSTIYIANVSDQTATVVASYYDNLGNLETADAVIVRPYGFSTFTPPEGLGWFQVTSTEQANLCGYTMFIKVNSNGNTSLSTMPLNALKKDDAPTPNEPDNTTGVNQVPVANFTVSSNNIDFGQSVTFDASSSLYGESYDWDLGDGNWGSGVSLTHTYAAPGTYTVKLYVNGPGGQGTATTTIDVVSNASYEWRVIEPDSTFFGEYTLYGDNGDTKSIIVELVSSDGTSVEGFDYEVEDSRGDTFARGELGEDGRVTIRFEFVGGYPGQSTWYKIILREEGKSADNVKVYVVQL